MNSKRWNKVAIDPSAGAGGTCSTGGDTSFSLFVDPGKYQYHSCAQIVSETKTWSRREQELKSLMDKADQSTGGAAVGFIAYKAEYVAAGEELELLRSTGTRAKISAAVSLLHPAERIVLFGIGVLSAVKATRQKDLSK